FGKFKMLEFLQNQATITLGITKFQQFEAKERWRRYRIVKRRKIERQGLTRPPKLGQEVMIHYTADCKCKKPPSECDCDLWYEGTILEEKPRDDKGDRVFYVDFECGDEDDIIWEIKG